MNNHQALVKNAFLWSLFIENISLQQGEGWQWKMLDALIEKDLPYPDVAKTRQATNGWAKDGNAPSEEPRTEEFSIGGDRFTITILGAHQAE